MAPARPTLEASERTTLGKRVATIRRDGRLPAVVFGHNVPSRPVSIDAHEFEQLRRHAGLHPLLDLTVDGGRPQTVIVHGVQIHPVTRRMLHVDLMAVKMTEEMIVDIPIEIVGTSNAIERLGGTLVHALQSVRVRALPGNLPQVVELSIEPLVDFDTTLHVRDLVPIEGVTILTDASEALVHVIPPRIEEVTAEAPAEGAEAAEAGEGGEAGAQPGAGEASEA